MSVVIVSQPVAIVTGDQTKVKVNQQVDYSPINRVVSFNCSPNFSSCWFTPERWCIHQWKNLTSPIEQDKNILCESIKRIAIAIPLTLATLVACVPTIPGFLTCSITTDNNVGITTITGSNRIETRKIDLSDDILRIIELSGTGNVVITYTEQQQYIEMTGDDNLLDYLIPHVSNQRLILGSCEGVSIRTRNSIYYHLYIPHKELNSLIISGSSSMQVDQLETDNLNCIISGNGTVNINNGRVTHQRVVISGNGEYNSPNFQAENSVITISGKGKAHIHTNQSLNITISGDGECFYSGTPQQVQRNISGTGHITHI